MPKPGHDGNVDVHAAMEYGFRTVFAVGKPNFPKEVEFSTDPTYFGGGSPNMKLLFCFTHLLWSFLTRDRSYSRHHERCINLLLQEQHLHGNNEPLTCSHGQLWVAGISGILWAAERINNQELYDLAAEWLRIEYALWKACEASSGGAKGPKARSGVPTTPGARGIVKLSRGSEPINTNTARTKAFSAIETGKLIGRRNQYDLGAAFISRLKSETREKIRPVDGSGNFIFPAVFPPMWGAFHVRRWANGDFFAYFDDLGGCLDPVLSAGVVNGVSWVSAKTVSAEKLDQTLRAHGDETPILTLDVEEGERRK